MSLSKWLDNGYLKKARPTKRDIDAKLGVAQRDLDDAARHPEFMQQGG